MKKIALTVCAFVLGAMALNAQNNPEQIEKVSNNAELVAKDAYVEFPYSKVMFATKSQLKAQKFKYDEYKNQMKLTHYNGLNVVASILSDIMTPAKEDYEILVQYGADDAISSIQVTFFDKDIYEHILRFADDKECTVKEISSGKGKKYTFKYGGYDFALSYKFKNVQHADTFTGTNDKGNRAYSSTSTQDFSYDQYTYVVETGVEPVSDYLRSKAGRKAKREASGKKAQSSADFL